MPDMIVDGGLGSALVIVLALAVYTQLRAMTISGVHQAIGNTVPIDGVPVHHVDVPGAEPAAPTLLFIHGASGNLREPMTALRAPFEGRYRMVFVDRPGHGWSGRKTRQDASPAVQADRIAGLLSALDVERAVLVGHSWGGSVAAAFALRHADKTAGLVFVAPATHPWRGGVNWYYRLAALPVLGWLFVNILALPAGLLIRRRTVRCVFAPAAVPDDYVEETGLDLVLRPATFRANAEDVVDLHGHVTQLAPDYPAIKAPTAIVADMADKVVYTHIHSIGLERDIDGAELTLVDGAGHMPHHSRRDVVVKAIEGIVDRAEKRLAEAGKGAPLEHNPTGVK